MEISNRDRVIFPEDGISKGEVCDYYAGVAELMLPFIEGRALTVERYPKGIDSKGFMQKNAPSHFGDELIDRTVLDKEDGGTTAYPVISSADAIVAFANLGVITFHVPPVRVDSEWHPDWMIWDLDPPEGELEAVRQAAVAIKAQLASFGISTALMASGSKGYHLRARIETTLSLSRAATIARGTAALACQAHPDLLTTEFRKSDRGERVFVDWLRNAALSTSVAPWSLRPRRGAPVATPLSWDELSTVAPDGVRLAGVARRFGFDPWAELETLDLSGTEDEVDDALRAAGIVLEPFDRFRS